jgi:hypothetical protein
MKLFLLLLFFSFFSSKIVQVSHILNLRSVWESPELQPAFAYINSNSKSNRSTQHSRIIKGKLANLGEFPFHVLVEADSKWFCGGSLIKPEWILTVRI